MDKVQILTACSHCGGEAYLPVGQELDARGQPYIRYRPCPACQGSGSAPRWVGLDQFIFLLEKAARSTSSVLDPADPVPQVPGDLEALGI